MRDHPLVLEGVNFPEPVYSAAVEAKTRTDAQASVSTTDAPSKTSTP